MKWLVTYKNPDEKDEVLEQLRSVGCKVVDPDRTIPLGAKEHVLAVEGPPDLPQLTEPFRSTMKVYPNSKMDAY